MGSLRGWGGPRNRHAHLWRLSAAEGLKELQKKFGFEPDRVVAVAKEVLGTDREGALP